MGKAVPRAVKIRANKLIELLPEKFSSDFEKNKSVLNELNLSFSKTDRNLIAGFITRKISNPPN